MTPVRSPTSIEHARDAERAGRWDDALATYEAAFARLPHEGDAGRAADLLRWIGTVHRARGDHDLASDAYHTSLAVARACGDQLLEAEAHRETALLELARDASQAALQALTRAHELFSKLAAWREVLDLEGRLGRLIDTYLEVVRSWAESIESNDRYTAGHCERVADYACRLAESQGITGRDLTWFRMGALMHDVGKIAVPPEILNKRGKLTDEECRVMQRHTIVGDRIVADIDFPWDVRPIVRNHHERWDGSGYPDGLVGEQIPLTARILCVADVFDALTTDRSYCAAMSRDEALRIMREEAGSVLDPALLDAFVRVIEEPPPVPAAARA